MVFVYPLVKERFILWLYHLLAVLYRMASLLSRRCELYIPFPFTNCVIFNRLIILRAMVPFTQNDKHKNNLWQKNSKITWMCEWCTWILQCIIHLWSASINFLQYVRRSPSRLTYIFAWTYKSFSHQYSGSQCSHNHYLVLFANNRCEVIRNL